MRRALGIRFNRERADSGVIDDTVDFAWLGGALAVAEPGEPQP